jgi:hypothetical protein
MLSTLIEASTLKALLLFAAKNGIRYYLNTLHIEQDATGTYAVTTDGHVIMVVHLDTTPLEPAKILINRDHVEAVLKMKLDYVPIEQLENNQVKIGSLTVSIADGVFPDWRRVTNAQQTGEIAYFNPEYLAMVNKAGRTINGGKKIYLVRQNGMAVGYAKLSENVHAYVMPTRTTNNDLPEPPRFN